MEGKRQNVSSCPLHYQASSVEQSPTVLPAGCRQRAHILVREQREGWLWREEAARSLQTDSDIGLRVCFSL